eukprot:scaffold52416_cov33-Tisochrysis_lutea.AAC.1
MGKKSVVPFGLDASPCCMCWLRQESSKSSGIKCGVRAVKETLVIDDVWRLRPCAQGRLSATSATTWAIIRAAAIRGRVVVM